MVLLDNDNFLGELAKLYQKCRTSGSVYVTMKQYYGQSKPFPKSTDRHSVSESSEHKCLVRATCNGKKKLSTVISSKDVTKFQMAYATLLKANMDGLKKRDKRSAKKSKPSKAT